MSEDPKTETTAAYEAYPAEFDDRFARYFAKISGKGAQTFLERLPGPRVLDAGSGPGHCAAFFREGGCDVLCLDISPAMAALCREKGLEAVVADMTTMDLDERFDGVWAHASLLHLRKDEAPRAAARLAEHLKPGGLLFASFKEGVGEGFEIHPDFPGVRRWYARYELMEARALFPGSLLPILLWKTTEGADNTFLNFLFRRLP